MEENIVKTTKCLNCGTEFQGKFCPECGQRADTSRFTIKFMIQNFILGILSNDGGVWFTIKNLFTRPGQMMVDIINGKRKSYFSPFPMLFLALSLYIVIFSFTGSKEKMYESVFSDNDVEEIVDVSEDMQADAKDALKINAKKKLQWALRFYDNNYTTVFILTIPIYIFCARICYGRANRKKYYRGEYCIPIIYSLIMVVFYRCLSSIVFYFSQTAADKMDGFNIWVTIAALTVCFRKMMGFKMTKMIWRSFLLYALYVAIVAFVIVSAVVVVVSILIYKT